MVQILGFSGNSTDRPRASTVEVLSVAGPIAGSETLEAVQAQHVTGAGGVGLSAAKREFFPLAQGDGSSPAAGDSRRTAVSSDHQRPIGGGGKSSPVADC